MAQHVNIREVGPRDGFQNEPDTIPTSDKVRLIEALAAAGLERLEVTSFVRADVIPQLEPYCSGFLCTFVDNEGTMKGTDLAWFRKLRRVTKKPITAAGGIRSLREVRALEKIGMHAAVGMALYLDKLSGS